MLIDPDVLENRPYWQYDAIEDEDTRPEHRIKMDLYLEQMTLFGKRGIPLMDIGVDVQLNHLVKET